uniref:DUF1501 domain-containing protein n=1 Tax=Odontella aurita TaxID=265563 RepID=A0A7S4JY73_9STRA|mmetsp:Transcript_57144/g.170332  ORF Transcript_57144/g.170332 Transcript_57144/m.170332 type:complete len:366 (+) Transcript_57144:670-1767(+)
MRFFFIFCHFSSLVKEGLDSLLPLVNTIVRDFWDEMKAQDLTDSVTFVQGSEFGRTLTPNGKSGTDHAWAGNYFAFGGGIDGGKILGQYPSSFGEAEPGNIGRGRLIPTTSWDSLWNGVAQWFGITDEADLNYVLPNRNNFGCRLFTDQDLYAGGTNAVAGCSGDQLLFELQVILDEARYLTPREQKELCQTLLPIVQEAVNNSTVLCMVREQRVEVVTEGGRRALSDSFSVSTEVEISYDESGLTGEVTQSLNENSGEVVQTMAEKGFFQGVTSVEDAVLMTYAPTEAPTPVPTVEPTAAPLQPSSNGVPDTQPNNNPAPVRVIFSFCLVPVRYRALSLNLTEPNCISLSTSICVRGPHRCHLP